MATLYERMQSAWATNEPNALDYEAERMARQGVAEAEIYAALEQLLLGLREAGLEEEADDRINDVMDRVTGWCHPSCHIRTTRDALPTEVELAKLPCWARVAFAVRCTRRVLPLFTLKWPDAPRAHLDQLVWAVKLSERTTSHAGRGENWASEHGAITSLAYVCDAVLYANRDRGRAAKMIKATGAAIAKFKDMAEETFAPHVGGPLSAIARNTSIDVANGIATSREAYDAAAVLANSLIRRDFDHLSRLAEAQRWDDDAPVPPEVFGPLWPEGPPKGWPPLTDAPQRAELVIEGFARDRATEQIVEDDVVKLFNALNRYHIARSGVRLTLDQFHSLLPASVPAEV